MGSITTFVTNKNEQEETTFSKWLLENLKGKSGQIVSLVARIAQNDLKQQKQRSNV